ncbi:double-strand break repair protein MRE11 [Sporothrix schenckii 1099-18]|uniref:Double-strand break repair protein n=1 Tax=Sporothrix schenckii 1099-18 TaxID=1397361 RepID=A0A0F2LZP7_SPOSC|nr:double-strand break repair protein MRE11 [Sporothrix schenckii 1099-18]KJR81960.1 double-strand break repair protein MRE11 [Sporothrix schenckii 1099-18]
MVRNAEPDTIRILVATDNHVGYEERDPIRKDDSWRTFDEIMNLARTEDVDMVLLGGDLFHDNKPSRKAMYQVMRSLRQNCLGMKPCELEFLSDAAEIFEGAVGHVNYEDPDINISIPVFSIHGNHDDPSGDGHYCSLDLLQVAGFVNYFGRVPEADNIKVKPVLLQKGATKLALFGTGNVRDERMFRTFRDHKVTFFRPNQQAADFFNLMVVHQNHHAHTATSYLPENFLPDWLDLVVWGHEHECLIDPQKNPETGFHVMQPGSSVATSLVPGEAVAKHVAIVSVTGKEFTVDKIPLKTVRPFVTRELVLAQEKRFKDLAKKRDNRAELTRRLMLVVEEMIEEARAEYMALHDNGRADANDANGDGNEDGDGDDDDETPLPLIRLKVEYTAPEGGNFDCENPQRFSNRFAGKVANVNDVIYFHRRKTTAGQTKAGTAALPGGVRDAAAGVDFNAIKVEALVDEYLAAQSLKILPQGEFGDAVNQFVNKDDKHAMDTFVSGSLANQLKDLLALGAEDEELDTAIERLRDERERQFQAGLVKQRHKRLYKPKPDDWDSDMEGHWEQHPGALLDPADSALSTPAPAPTAASHARSQLDAVRARAAAASSRAGPSSSIDEDLMMDDFDSLAPVAVTKTTAAKRTTKSAAASSSRAKATTSTRRAPAAKRSASGRKKGPFEDSESDEDDVVMDDDDDVDEEEEADEIEDDGMEEPAPPPTRRGRAAPARAPARGAAAAKSATSKAAAAAAKPATGRLRQTTLQLSQSQAPAPSQRPRAAAAPTTTRGKKAAVQEISADEISDDSDDFEPPPTTRTTRRR